MGIFAAPDEVARRTRALLDEVGGRPGHVLNLGHGVIKHTDPECVGAFVSAAQEGGR
jgi:uroporphyrinogen decarboxylase